MIDVSIFKTNTCDVFPFILEVVERYSKALPKRVYLNVLNTYITILVPALSLIISHLVVILPYFLSSFSHTSCHYSPLLLVIISLYYFR